MSKQNTTQAPATVGEAQSRLHAAIASLGEAAGRLRELRPASDGVDHTSNELVAALVDTGVLDSRLFGAPLTMIQALDPKRQEELRKRRAEEARLARESEARRNADPVVIAELHERALTAARHRVNSYRNIPAHQNAIEARRQLAELEALSA